MDRVSVREEEESREEEEAVSVPLPAWDPLSWRNKGHETGRAEQLIEDLWLTEYADMRTVIDQDPHTALGYIFAFRERKNERRCGEGVAVVVGWLVGGGGVERVQPEEKEKTARGEHNGEKNALAN